MEMDWNRARICVERFERTASVSLDTLELHIERIRSLKRAGKLEEAKKEEASADRAAQQILSIVHQVLTVQGDLNEENQLLYWNEISPVKSRIESVMTRLKTECQGIYTQDSKRDFEEERNIWEEESPSTSDFYSDHTPTLQKNIELKDMRDRVVHDAQIHSQLAQDISEIEGLMQEMASLVHSQQDMVDSIENNVENASHNVKQGERDLKKSVKYKTASYPLAGAAVGAAVAGGPIGMLIGLKVGIAAAVGGAVAGVAGRKLWKKKTIEETHES